MGLILGNMQDSQADLGTEASGAQHGSEKTRLYLCNESRSYLVRIDFPIKIEMIYSQILVKKNPFY